MTAHRGEVYALINFKWVRKTFENRK